MDPAALRAVTAFLPGLGLPTVVEVPPIELYRAAKAIACAAIAESYYGTKRCVVPAVSLTPIGDRLVVTGGASTGGCYAYLHAWRTVPRADARIVRTGHDVCRIDLPDWQRASAFYAGVPVTLKARLKGMRGEDVVIVGPRITIYAWPDLEVAWRVDPLGHRTYAEFEAFYRSTPAHARRSLQRIFGR